MNLDNHLKTTIYIYSNLVFESTEKFRKAFKTQWF